MSCKFVVHLFVFVLLKSVSVHCQTPHNSNSSVLNAGALVQNALEKCYFRASKEIFSHFLPSLQQCIKDEALHVLESIHRNDVLELFNGVQLVDKKMSNSTTYKQFASVERLSFGESWAKTLDWKTQIILKLHRLLHSHNLQVPLKLMNVLEKQEGLEGRVLGVSGLFVHVFLFGL